MKNKYWFKPKKTGYGYVPISLEGWLATLAFVTVLFISAYINDLFTGPESFSVDKGWRFLLDVFIFSFIFHLVCKKKVSGELKWSLGFKTQKKKKKK